MMYMYMLQLSTSQAGGVRVLDSDTSDESDGSFDRVSFAVEQA